MKLEKLLKIVPNEKVITVIEKEHPPIVDLAKNFYNTELIDYKIAKLSTTCWDEQNSSTLEITLN